MGNFSGTGRQLKPFAFVELINPVEASIDTASNDISKYVNVFLFIFSTVNSLGKQRLIKLLVQKPCVTLLKEPDS